MLLTPVVLVLIGFVASLTVLIAAYAVHCGVNRLVARRAG